MVRSHICVSRMKGHISPSWPDHCCPPKQDHPPSIRLRSLLYSQWDSVAALCAPGHLVPRIQQQPAEPPAAGRHPPWSQAPAPVLLPLLPSHSGFQLSKYTPLLPYHPTLCHNKGLPRLARGLWSSGLPQQLENPSCITCCHQEWDSPLSGLEECIPCSAPPKAW